MPECQSGSVQTILKLNACPLIAPGRADCRTHAGRRRSVRRLVLFQINPHRLPAGHLIGTVFVLVAVDVETAPESFRGAVLADVLPAADFDDCAEADQRRTRYRIAPAADIGPGGGNTWLAVGLFAHRIIAGDIGFHVYIERAGGGRIGG